MIQKALRYTRCVQIPKKNTVVVINNNSSFYFNKDHISDFKRSLIKATCRDSRPIGRTVQESLFKRIRISSDCEEVLQTSCISHSQTNSYPQITLYDLSHISFGFYFIFFSSCHIREVPASV